MGKCIVQSSSNISRSSSNINARDRPKTLSDLVVRTVPKPIFVPQSRVIYELAGSQQKWVFKLLKPLSTSIMIYVLSLSDPLYILYQEDKNLFWGAIC